MKKADLLSKIAGDADISKAQADAALKSFIDAVGDSLKAGDKLSLLGLGTFSKNHRPARQSVNPQNPKGPKIDIAAKNVVKFKAGKALNEKIN